MHQNVEVRFTVINGKDILQCICSFHRRLFYNTIIDNLIFYNIVGSYIAIARY